MTTFAVYIGILFIFISQQSGPQQTLISAKLSWPDVNKFPKALVLLILPPTCTCDSHWESHRGTNCELQDGCRDDLTHEQLETHTHICIYITIGSTLVCTQHCSYWYPGAKAPGHQYPQCWLNILRFDPIGPVSYKNITVNRTKLENTITCRKNIQLFNSKHNQVWARWLTFCSQNTMYFALPYSIYKELISCLEDPWW